MNSTALQSALREWTMLIRTPRLWATFGIVVSIFVTTGPSGTIDTMGLAERAAFWSLLHAAAWAIAIFVITLGEIWLAAHIRGQTLLLALNAIAATPFVAAAVEAVRWSWLGAQPTLGSYGEQMLVCLPLSVLFSLLSHMTMSSRAKEAMVDTMPLTPMENRHEPRPPLLERLKPELRGPLIHLTVEDHYTVVTTSRGRQLVLLRFADAVKETGTTDGVQTHRSHWVAVDHVACVTRSGTRLVVQMKSGEQIPVSRSYADQVRNRFPVT